MIPNTAGILQFEGKEGVSGPELLKSVEIGRIWQENGTGEAAASGSWLRIQGLKGAPPSVQARSQPVEHQSLLLKMAVDAAGVTITPGMTLVS